MASSRASESREPIRVPNASWKLSRAVMVGVGRCRIEIVADCWSMEHCESRSSFSGRRPKSDPEAAIPAGQIRTSVCGVLLRHRFDATVFDVMKHVQGQETSTMRIDPKTEQVLTLAEACRSIPPRGVSRATLFRWIQKGVRGAVLSTIVIGGRRHTSRQAIDRFIVAGNTDDTPAAPTFTVEQRSRMSVAARATLAAEFGI